MKTIVALAVLMSSGAALAQEVIQATPDTYAGRIVLCTSKWNKDSASEAAADKERVKVGKAYYVKECNRQLCHAAAAKNVAVKCRS